MADLPQALVTGGTALVSALAGAGVTYWLGALNRRHQEEREDKTRWYEARRETYAALLIASHRMSLSHEEATLKKPINELADELSEALGAVHLVGSPEAIEAADKLFIAILQDGELLEEWLHEVAQRQAEYSDEEVELLKEELDDFFRTRMCHVPEARKAFEQAARKDLGHPEPLSLLRSALETEEPSS